MRSWSGVGKHWSELSTEKRIPLWLHIFLWIYMPATWYSSNGEEWNIGDYPLVSLSIRICGYFQLCRSDRQKWKENQLPILKSVRILKKRTVTNHHENDSLGRTQRERILISDCAVRQQSEAGTEGFVRISCRSLIFHTKHLPTLRTDKKCLTLANLALKTFLRGSDKRNEIWRLGHWKLACLCAMLSVSKSCTEFSQHRQRI